MSSLKTLMRALSMSLMRSQSFGLLSAEPLSDEVFADGFTFLMFGLFGKFGIVIVICAPAVEHSVVAIVPTMISPSILFILFIYSFEHSRLRFVIPFSICLLGIR